MIDRNIRKWKARRLNRRTIDEPVSVVDIEPQILEVAKIHARFYIESYKINPRRNWEGAEDTGGEEKFQGLVAELSFRGILQEYEIPHLWSDPTYPFTSKLYDFYIPDIGTIEIKSISHEPYKVRLLIRCDVWSKCDYVVTIKFSNSEFTQAKIMGWLHGSEIEELSIRDFGKGNCYWEWLKNLHPFSGFLKLIGVSS